MSNCSLHGINFLTFSVFNDQVVFKIAGSRDASVILWDVDQGKPVATLKGHKYQVDLSYHRSFAFNYFDLMLFTQMQDFNCSDSNLGSKILRK